MIVPRSPLRLTLGAALCLMSSLCGCESNSRAARAEEAVAVSVAVAEQKDVPREVASFGTVEASSSVDIVSQVQGLVTEVHFKEGDFVERGAPLFTIDTRPYRASLAAAQAELVRSRALADQAKLEAERAERLRVEGVATDQDVVKAQADAASTAASVKMGQAQMQSASLNVAFTRISAPMAGRTGSLLVHPGNLVRPTDTRPLVTLRSLTPVYVRFSVPQENLPAIRAGMKGGLTVRATPRGEGATSVDGPLTFLDNSVDATTGTIALKATFTNAGQELWPGAAVDVALVLGVDRGATVVPEAALQRSQTGALVFVIGQDGRAESRPVSVLRSTETLALIGSGVRPGESVVIDGQLRLRNGTKVSVKAPAKSPSATVTPEERRPEGL
jgi:multidrug efflux system membrane fusion protein